MKRITMLVAVLVVSVLVVGCVQAQPPVPEENPAAGGPSAGLQLAPGFYDLEDGTAQAVGTLGYSDLEGGFWLVTGGTDGTPSEGETVAVIANGESFEDELAPLEGRRVLVTGTRLEGASIRMAGPEIEMSAIEAMSDEPGIAE